MKNASGKRLLAAAAWVGMVTMAGCGSGEDAPVVPVADVLSLSGSAATGMAISGGAVQARCATGSGSATTSATGAFTLNVEGGRLPCALRVTDSGGTVLHSLVAGSGGGNFNVNVTPLTEMVVARASGMAPATFFSGLSAGTVLGAATLTQAIDDVRAALAGVVDLNGVNPLSDTLVAASPGVPGNALDQKVDAALAALAAANLTLADAAASFAANPQSPDVLKSALQPAAGDCARARSGNYRMINPSEADPKWRAHVLQIDMAALMLKDQDGDSVAFTSLGGCKFGLTEGDGTVNTIVVAPSGVLVVLTQAPGGGRSVTIGLPEQALPLSAFAGDWNVIGWDPASGSQTPGYVAQTAKVAIDGSGQLTAIADCAGLQPCVADTGPFPKFVANTAGGFNIVEDNAVVGRAFLFKTLAGAIVGVLILDDGQLIVFAKAQANPALPALNSQSAYWEFTLNGNGSITSLGENSVTNTAVDAATKTVTRIRASDGRVDSFTYDKPADGWRYRAPNSCTVNGVANNCAEVMQLPLQGLGITLSASVGSNPASSFISVSIGKP